MGYNKLILSYKIQREKIWKAIKFILECQRNQEISDMSKAYRSLKKRRNKLLGVGMTKSQK